MKMQIAVILTAFLLAGCTGFDAYAPPPECISDIDAERAMHNTRVARVQAARTTKNLVSGAVVGAVALGALAPPLAIVGPVLDAIRVNTEGNAERSKFLAYARLVAKDC